MYLLGGALYYIKGSGDVKTKVVCGVEEANAIFVDFHDSPTGAHSGQKKTRDAISKRFHWPGMTTDIDKWVRMHEISHETNSCVILFLLLKSFVVCNMVLYQ